LNPFDNGLRKVLEGRLEKALEIVRNYASFSGQSKTQTKEETGEEIIASAKIIQEILKELAEVAFLFVSFFQGIKTSSVDNEVKLNEYSKKISARLTEFEDLEYHIQLDLKMAIVALLSAAKTTVTTLSPIDRKSFQEALVPALKILTTIIKDRKITNSPSGDLLPNLMKSPSLPFDSISVRVCNLNPVKDRRYYVVITSSFSQQHFKTSASKSGSWEEEFQL
jgi:hypothetical protein